MVYRIDVSGVSEPADFHERLAAAMPLPAYYGNNLDALYDVLMEMGEPCEIRFLHMEQMERQLPDYVAQLKQLCSDVMEENETVKISSCL